MNGIVILIASIYLLIVILIGIWATRKTKSTSDFYVAGKSLGMVVMAIAAFSSIQSGFGMVGGTGLTFKGGLGFVASVGFGAALGFPLSWFLVGKRMWQLHDLGEIYTLGDVVEKRYNSRAARGWMGLAVALGVLGYLGTQVQAMGIVMNAIFGVSPGVGAIIGLAILTFYVIGGGMLAGVYTDLFQGSIMVIVSIFIFIAAVGQGGGIANMSHVIKQWNPQMATAFGTYPLISMACWFFLFSLGAAGQPHFITKFLMIKDTKQLKWGAFTASLSYAISTLLTVGIAFAAIVLNIQGKFPKISNPDAALTTFLTNFTSPFLAGLVVSGLLAAIMSTGSSFATLGAASLVRDIPRAFNFQVKNELLWSRIMVGILMVASTLFALYMNTLVALLGVFGWGTFASAIFPPVVLGLVWPKATKHGAIGSMVISLLINFVLEVGGKYGLKVLPTGVVNGAFALAVSIIAFIVISLLTQSSAPRLDQRLEEVIQG